MNLSSLTYFLKNCPKRSGKLGLWRELRVVCQKLYDVFHVIDVSRCETNSNMLTSVIMTGGNFVPGTIGDNPIVNLISPFYVNDVSKNGYGQLMYIALVVENVEYVLAVSSVSYNPHTDSLEIFPSGSPVLIGEGMSTAKMQMYAFFVRQSDSSYWTK